MVAVMGGVLDQKAPSGAAGKGYGAVSKIGTGVVEVAAGLAAAAAAELPMVLGGVSRQGYSDCRVSRISRPGVVELTSESGQSVQR